MKAGPACGNKPGNAAIACSGCATAVEPPLHRGLAMAGIGSRIGGWHAGGGRRVLRVACTRAVAIVTAAAVLGGIAASARADVSPLSWSPYTTIDPPTYDLSQVAIGPVSCVGQTLCVAGDDNYVATSTDPTGGWGAWTLARVGNSGIQMTGMSCATVSLCVAVDWSGDVITSTRPTGGAAAWNVAAVDGTNQLESVSCASASLCVAVDNAGNVVTSTTPTGGASVWHTANIDTHPLASVSCPSATLCVAVGQSPSSVFTSTNPAGGSGAWHPTTVTGLTLGLVAVSCATPIACVALDGYNDIVTTTNPTGGPAAWSYATGPVANVGVAALSCTTAVCVAAGASNGRFLTSTNPGGGASAWAVSDAPTAPASMSGVSCTSTGLCVASARPGGLSYGSLLTTTNPSAGGSAWTEAPVQTQIAIYGLSCPSASLCFAVDSRGNVVSSISPAGGAGAWNRNNVTGTGLYGIACPSASLCVAVDYAGKILTSGNPTGDYSSWTAATVDGTTSINAVACPSTSLCVAVDDKGNALTSTNPTGGSGAWQVTNVDGTTPLGSVACAAPTLCVAVDDLGNGIVSTNPTGGASAWHAASVDPGNILTGIACPTTTLCVAVDDVGNVVASTAPAGGAAAWTAASVDPGNSLNAVSCSGIGQCVAVDGAGNEVNAIDPSGGLAAWTGTRVSTADPSPFGGPGPRALYAVSCPAETLCVAGGAWNNAFIGRPVPSNLSSPTVSGAAALGQALQEGHGTWTDSPTAYDVFWERCDRSGADCIEITNASGQTYQPATADLGHALRTVEIASNGNGSGNAIESDPTAVVVQYPPANTSPPQIAGAAVVGQTLTEIHGAWSNGPTSFAYQWEICDSAGTNCSPIYAATSQTLVLSAVAGGHAIRVQEAASNAGGASRPAPSAATGVVATPPPPGPTSPQIKAALSASITPSGKLAKISAVLKAGGYALQFKALEAGRAIASWYLVPNGARLAGANRPAKPLLIATGKIDVSGSGTYRVTLKLTAAGKSALAHAKTLKLTVKLAFMPISGALVTATKKFTLKR